MAIDPITHKNLSQPKSIKNNNENFLNWAEKNQELFKAKFSFLKNAKSFLILDESVFYFFDLKDKISVIEISPVNNIFENFCISSNVIFEYDKVINSFNIINYISKRSLDNIIEWVYEFHLTYDNENKFSFYFKNKENAFEFSNYFNNQLMTILIKKDEISGF